MTDMMDSLTDYVGKLAHEVGPCEEIKHLCDHHVAALMVYAVQTARMEPDWAEAITNGSPWTPDAVGEMLEAVTCD